MPNKTGATTKARLAESAWKLFYEKGYDNTTIEDIVDDSGTSKGSFYHYFNECFINHIHFFLTIFIFKIYFFSTNNTV